MDDLSSLWSYHQEGIDDLKQRLLYATIDLESFKMEAKDQILKSEENLKNVFDVLKVAQKERDEAREQLQKLLNKIMPCSLIDMPNVFPQAQPESPILLPAIANSSITESNSHSETYNNHQSHGSSPVDSVFDTVSSPELPNINLVDSNNMCFPNQQSLVITKTDEASAVFENIAKGKVLPQKGKLLQTVMEAGPLLQTLLVAGPLPRWRNPPQMQALKIPPFSAKGCENTSNSLAYPEMSGGFQRACSSSLLNFTGSPPNSSLNSTRLLGSSSCLNSQIPVGKRQRLQ